jgi:hypothetical protein
MPKFNVEKDRWEFGPDEDEPSFSELVERYITREKIYHLEGEQGVRNLTNLVRVLNSDYSNFDYFLEDNPGCMRAIVDWIEKTKVLEWKRAFQDEIFCADSEGENS